ncbi:MAG TPA: L-ribulose-5-phosphate 4-epimerase [Bacteroidota bacterium]|nr:L-ribulose-5-phosphate 4-epimerase [Bacteroidota bacterium]
MRLRELKEEVLEANLDLARYRLVTLTWGNVSGILRDEGLVVIKPSGVDYDKLRVADLVVLNLEGKVVEGAKRPSSDTPTHLELYRAFKTIGGVAHTHSTYATSFAQACREIRCYGTTHADAFYGSVPVTRFLTKEEVAGGYELNTGRLIIERFRGLDPDSLPAVLLAGHAPFTWGSDPRHAVLNSLMLERVAKMAIFTEGLHPGLEAIPDHILQKHHERKHGPDAYYGQPAPKGEGRQKNQPGKRRKN